MSTAFEIKCCNRGCLLAKGYTFADVSAAELTAFAHESRWRDELVEPHVVTVDLVASDAPPTGATGVRHG